MTWITKSLLAFSLMMAAHAWAEEKIALIVSKSSAIQKLSAEQVKTLFLGQTRFAEEGKVVNIADRDRNSPIYKEFYQLSANMSPKEVGVHWAKKVFTGEAPPPARLTGDDTAAKEWVKTHDDGLTYIYAKNADAKIRVVATLEGAQAR